MDDLDRQDYIRWAKEKNNSGVPLKQYTLKQWRKLLKDKPHKPHKDKIPPKVREQVLERDGYTCTACKAEATLYRKMHVHHVQHRAQGGTHEIDNLTTLCDACHIIAHDGEAITNLMRKALIL